MNTENLAFRALAAITAGFFWLAIMRFLSSFDAQVQAQEATAQALAHLRATHEIEISKHDTRIRNIETRLQATGNKKAADNEA